MSIGLDRLKDNLACSNCKELKALEILKNALGIHLVETIENKHYIEITGQDMIGLCKENYDILKEVLK